MQVLHHNLPRVWLGSKHVGTACCTIVLLADFGRSATTVGRRKMLHSCRAAGGLARSSQQLGQGAPAAHGRRPPKRWTQRFRAGSKEIQQYEVLPVMDASKLFSDVDGTVPEGTASQILGDDMISSESAC